MAYTLRVEEAAQFASSVPILDAMGVRVRRGQVRPRVAELPPEPNVNHFGVTYAGSLYSVPRCSAASSASPPSTSRASSPASCRSSRSRRSGSGGRRWASYARPASLSDVEVARVRADALATGKGEFVLEATLTDAQGEVVASTVGTYQVRRLG